MIFTNSRNTLSPIIFTMDILHLRRTEFMQNLLGEYVQKFSLMFRKTSPQLMLNFPYTWADVAENLGREAQPPLHKGFKKIEIFCC